MLKTIDPNISSELLYAIHRMGHGDEIVIVDANFPANSMGTEVVSAAGVNATTILGAILPLFPIDDFVDEAAFRMEVVGNPTEIPPVCQEFQKTLGDVPIVGIERFAFYERAKKAFVIVSTSEARLYG